MFVQFISVLVGCILLFFYFTTWVFTRRQLSVENKHVVITGGSSGIGKSLAILVAKLGAHVTIVARNPLKLQEAEEEIRKSCPSTTQYVSSSSLDITNFEDVNKYFNAIDATVAPIFMLINAAGMSMCAKIEDTKVSDVHKLMEVNYYGTYYSIKAIINKMKERRSGIVILTGSQASLLGIFGYSAYSSSKFALRGLAESLDMEVRPYDINVTLSLPPDTDTPGFELENKSKLKETMLISESGGLYKSEEVANKILYDALGRKFYSTIGLESFLLTTLCAGMVPSSMFDILCQSVLLGPLKLISSFYLTSYHNIVKKCIKFNEK